MAEPPRLPARCGAAPPHRGPRKIARPADVRSPACERQTQFPGVASSSTSRSKQLVQPCSWPTRASIDANSAWWNVISVRPSRSASVTVTRVSGPDLPCSSTHECVNTSRLGGTISRYTPRRRCSVPSGERMRAEKTPPTRSSPRFSLKVKPRGQDHCASSCGSVQARNTNSRGALKVRRMFSSRSAVALFRTLASMSLLLSLRLAEVTVEAAEAALPVAAVAFGPLGDLAQRRRLQAAGARLSAPAAAHESRALEHLQVLGDRRLAHGERARQLHHTRFAASEPREDRPARRVGERGEGVVEAVVGRH